MKLEKKRLPALSFSHVLPVSWLSKLRQMSTRSPPAHPAKIKRKNKTKSPVSNSSVPVRLKSSRVGERDTPVSPYSNLPFSPETLDKRTGRSVTGSVEPEDDYWRFSFRKSFDWKENLASFDRDLECKKNFNFAMCDVKGRSTSPDIDILPQVRNFAAEKDRRNRRPRKVDQAALGEESTDIYERYNRNSGSSSLSKSSDHSGSRSREAAFVSSVKLFHPSQEDVDRFPPLNLRRSSHRRRTRGTRQKDGDAKSPTSDSRRCENVNKGLKRRMLKQKLALKEELFSPRTMCKVRALEEIKRKKRGGSDRDFETYAVAVTSFDPQKDFRDSMVEMITENRIVKPAELENLLACYLSLNSEDYHDVIVKVFRQVWFDLNRDRLTKTPEQRCPDH